MTYQTNTAVINTPEESTQVVAQVGKDFKNAIFVVSIFANLVVFTLWITLEVTSQYNTQLAAWLLNH